MRIHRLQFGALGPFAGEHDIDVDGLGSSTLFLIDGPTGAGKSAIIDAIVFGLYGEVAGQASDKQRLRSSFAAPTAESFVEIEFSTSSGRYRVRRTPEYERPKARGEGTTTAASSVSAWRSAGPESWDHVSSRKAEADAEIREWIGLSRAQFLQTIVLPQGEFATFLKSESRDRQEILQRIFATEIFAGVEQVLEASRKAADDEREAAQGAVDTAIGAVFGRLPDGYDPALIDDCRADQGREPVLRAIDSLVTQIDTDLTAARRDLAAADSAVEGARAEGRRLDDAEQAHARLDGAQLTLDRARAGVAATRERLQECATALAGTDPDDPASAQLALEREIGALGADLTAEEEIPALARTVEAHAVAVQKGQAAIDALDAERDTELPARLSALAAAVSATLAAARERSQAAEDHETAAIQSRFDGMAGELAQSLATGEPCRVCGSTEHPHPAPVHPDAVTAQAVEAAGRDRVAAAGHLAAVQAQEARLAGQVQVPASADTDPLPVDSIVEEADAIASRSRGLASQRADLVEALASSKAQHQSASKAHEAALRRVESARGAFASVAARGTALTAARDALGAHATAVSALDAAKRDVDLHATAAIAAGERPSATDVDQARLHLESVEAAHGTATGAVASLTSLVDDLRTRRTLVVEAFDAWDDVDDRTRDAILLANVAAGRAPNTLSQPLSAFVVQAMFDEVLASANRRLLSMLDGRFELVSTEARTGRALLGQGLGLSVRDLRTDTERKTTTLSGGESFCASLALALGLADTVRAHAGGIELGMLFIDEGFGSLDVERLEEVMAELGKLQADGRVVGLISHVTEMKSAVHDRIDVRPLGPTSGSTLTVSWA